MHSVSGPGPHCVLDYAGRMVEKGHAYVILAIKTGASQSSRFSPHRRVLNYSEECKAVALKDVDPSKIKQKERARELAEDNKGHLHNANAEFSCNEDRWYDLPLNESAAGNDVD